MARHVVSVPATCSRCGSPTERIYVAESKATRLVFSSSLRCSNCNLAEEIDGPELTEAAREAFCKAEGRWSLSVRGLGTRRTEALRALCKVLQQTPVAILQILREQKPIAVGPPVEIERIESRLEAAGAEVEIAQCE